MKTYHYRDPAGVTIGLNELRRRGLTPRGLCFLALDPRGETSLAVPEDMERVTEIRVGDKLGLATPWEGRFFYFDSIHRLPAGAVIYNGDRRLHHTGSAQEVAVSVGMWLKGGGARDVFLGCTPHQPGAWYCEDERTPAIALHDAGYVDVTVAAMGLVARRIGDNLLYYMPYSSLKQAGPLEGWVPVFSSNLGNILMLERRVVSYSLVLTCEYGLIEVDLSGLPMARERERAEGWSGLGVVGRVDGGAYAITQGRVEPWGLADVQPAILVGSPSESLHEILGFVEEADVEVSD